jgi:hypothetical protein
MGATVLDSDIVKVQTWWMGVVKQITRQVMDDEEKRQARARKKAEKSLGEFRTFADVQDAYGCGVISEKKRDKLYDLLEQVKPEEDRTYQMKLDMLSEMYQIAKQAVEDHKG